MNYVTIFVNQSGTSCALEEKSFHQETLLEIWGK